MLKNGKDKPGASCETPLDQARGRFYDLFLSTQGPNQAHGNGEPQPIDCLVQATAALLLDHATKGGHSQFFSPHLSKESKNVDQSKTSGFN